MLSLLYDKWPSPKVLPLALAPSTSTYIFSLYPLKILNLVQRARWTWGTTGSPIFSVSVFSINKHFLIPNSDILSFGLSKHRAHRFGISYTSERCTDQWAWGWEPLIYKDFFVYQPFSFFFLSVFLLQIKSRHSNPVTDMAENSEDEQRNRHVLVLHLPS